MNDQNITARECKNEAVPRCNDQTPLFKVLRNLSHYAESGNTAPIYMNDAAGS